jgi:hypothetical protein
LELNLEELWSANDYPASEFAVELVSVASSKVTAGAKAAR